MIVYMAQDVITSEFPGCLLRSPKVLSRPSAQRARRDQCPGWDRAECLERQHNVLGGHGFQGACCDKPTCSAATVSLCWAESDIVLSGSYRVLSGIAQGARA